MFFFFYSLLFIFITVLYLFWSVGFIYLFIFISNAESWNFSTFGHVRCIDKLMLLRDGGGVEGGGKGLLWLYLASGLRPPGATCTVYA